MASNICKSTSELRSAIQREMISAMYDVRGETERIADRNVWSYYLKGKPTVYKRTYTLPHSQYTTPLNIFGGNDIIFETSFDEGRVSWNTGTYSPFEVLEATEFHESGVLGKSHFFENTEKEIDNIINKAFRSKGFR